MRMPKGVVEMLLKLAVTFEFVPVPVLAMRMALDAPPEIELQLSAIPLLLPPRKMTLPCEPVEVLPVITMALELKKTIELSLTSWLDETVMFDCVPAKTIA